MPESASRSESETSASSSDEKVNEKQKQAQEEKTTKGASKETSQSLEVQPIVEDSSQLKVYISFFLKESI